MEGLIPYLILTITALVFSAFFSGMEIAFISSNKVKVEIDIKKGGLLTEENLTVKRPGTGISPMRWEEVVGTKAIKDFSEEDLIEI